MTEKNINKIKQKVLLVNIKNTHPDIYGDKISQYTKIKFPGKEQEDLQIKGAAQCCWLVDKKRVKECDYVFAVFEGRVCGVYKLTDEKCILAKDVSDSIDILKSKNQFVNFPPYREIEMVAHKCGRCTDRVENARQKVKEHLSLKTLEVADLALDDIPLKAVDDLSKWDKRKFLILERCNDEFATEYKDKTLYRGNEKFRFYGAIEYLPKEK